MRLARGPNYDELQNKKAGNLLGAPAGEKLAHAIQGLVWQEKAETGIARLQAIIAAANQASGARRQSDIQH